MADAPAPGTVTLVGGGPGAEDLITVRGLDRLLAADVVVTDRLAPTGLLGRLPAGVEIVDAARGPDTRALTHDQIVGLMIERARAGRAVVRLKGGDPFVFAHGAQEVAACVAAGVPVEVVPGVSSATAAAGLAGVELTGVGGAAGFSVVSGHLAPDDPSNRVDWTSLARSGTTIVVLMGVRQLARIADRLMADGVPADTDAACIAEASLPGQQVVRARLDELADAVAAAGVRSPATVVVGAGAGREQRRVLVLGGSRSGKSRYAEGLVAADATVTYVATASARPGDEEWTRRVEAHRARRPSSWSTVETRELVPLLATSGRTLLIDSVTTWLAGVLDDCGCWMDRRGADEELAAVSDVLVQAFATTGARVVAVSDEVGCGVVPDSAAGRRFRDELGTLNQRLAAVADEVWLVTAGIPRRIA